MKGMERKKKSRFGWEKCFHNQEELFKLANIMWPNDPLPFIFLLACFPPPREHLKKGKEQADVPGSCWWEFRGTSELLFSLQRHPAGNHDSQLGHKGLAINLGIWWILKTFATAKERGKKITWRKTKFIHLLCNFHSESKGSMVVGLL